METRVEVSCRRLCIIFGLAYGEILESVDVQMEDVPVGLLAENLFGLFIQCCNVSLKTAEIYIF